MALTRDWKAMPSLAICIPTYNRSAYLAELLDSVVSQETPELEVVVSDDASPDDTAAMIEKYRAKFSNFKFIRQEKNIGLDQNFLAVVAASTADYVWLMGDDDRLEPGGVSRVLDALKSWPGVSGLTLGVVDYNVDLSQRTGVRVMPPTQHLERVEDVFAQIPEHLGFMSALVVDRKKWLEVARDDTVGAFKNYYVQVYILGRVVQRFGGWGVVHEPCVGFRSSNDQLLAKFGWIERLKIDVVAYDQIAEGLFGKDMDTRRAMRRRVFDSHVMARLRNAKTQPGRTPGLIWAAGYLFSRYGGISTYWTKALPTLFAPKWMLRSVRAIYKRYGRSGAARARALNAVRR